jgi:hypothetical protein
MLFQQPDIVIKCDSSGLFFDNTLLKVVFLAIQNMGKIG